jgi:hypothetical protein
VRASLVLLAFWLALAACSGPSTGDCSPGDPSVCHGNVIATCEETSGASCDGIFCNEKYNYVEGVPCPAAAPDCEDIPGQTRLDQKAVCQVASLDKTCALLPAPVASASVVADLNGDGHTDFLSLEGGQIVVSLGAGDRTFRGLPPQPGTPDTGVPPDVLTGDFNGDGVLDLVFDVVEVEGDAAPYASTTTLSVAFGQHGGIFGAVQTVPATAGLGLFAVADVNGDHVDDVLGYDSQANTITVVLGSPASLRALPAQTLTPCVTSPCAPVVPGDFDGDGYVDVLFSDGFRTGLMRGSADGAFSFSPLMPGALPTRIFAPYRPGLSGVTATDINEDGRLDLVVSDVSGTRLLLGRGDGTFADPVGLNVAPYSPGSALVADEDGDGHVDLLLADVSMRVLILLRSVGEGIFAPPVFVQPSLDATSFVAALDSRTSARRDLVVAGSSGLLVLPGSCF